MGGSVSKEPFKAAISDLINNQQAVASLDDSFWERYWSDPNLTSHDVFTCVTRTHINELMSTASGNLTALCFKVVSRISAAVSTACSGPNEHVIVLNCVRLLTRLLPFLFESNDWRLLFWTPAHISETSEQNSPPALAQVLLDALVDLLFCPDFTVISKVNSGPEKPDDLSSLDTSEYIWDIGIGCSQSPGTTPQIDKNRTEIIKLLITCFSENLYITTNDHSSIFSNNQWLAHFTSANNRHVLPLLTSLLNITCSYDPVGYGVPYYYALVSDFREELVESSVNLLSVLFNYSPPPGSIDTSPRDENLSPAIQVQRETKMANLFLAYISRLHQSEDLEFLVKGFVSLIANPLHQTQTYLPASVKRIYFNEVLYIVLWKLISHNQKFLAHLLKGPMLFELIVPLLCELLNTRNNPSMVGMLHVGVFILLMLSGERNFGVRLNKPFISKVKIDVPRFTGTHADLLFLVFHKIITGGLSRIQPMYDCLLTVLVNVSPYLKSLSMITCTRLMHLMESFSTAWYLFAKPTNHYLIFYLLEIFNNIIQYQFDGNINLVYSLVRSKEIFYELASLSEESCLSIFPRARPTFHDKIEEVEVTREEEGEQTTQTVPEIQPLKRVEMEEIEITHEDSETVTEHSPDHTLSSPGHTLSSPGHSLSPGATSKPISEKETFPTFSSSYDPPVKSSSKSATPTKNISRLLPLRKQVAVGNKQLVEPTTPTDFKPTPEWVRSWKQRLPLHTVLRLLQILVPQVEKLCTENDVKGEKEILEYLRNGTLVGLLPVPHPIIIRKYQSSQNTEQWFHTYIWGVVYSRNFDPPIWYDTQVKLFIVNKTE